jgi:hypothetical protein
MLSGIISGTTLSDLTPEAGQPALIAGRELGPTLLAIPMSDAFDQTSASFTSGDLYRGALWADCQPNTLIIPP